MRNKVVVALCLLVLVVVSGVAVNQFNDEAMRRNVANAQSLQLEQAKRAERQAIYKKEVEQVKADCLKLRDFYDGQSVAYQKTNPKRPNCNLTVIQ